MSLPISVHSDDPIFVACHLLFYSPSFARASEPSLRLDGPSAVASTFWCTYCRPGLSFPVVNRAVRLRSLGPPPHVLHLRLPFPVLVRCFLERARSFLCPWISLASACFAVGSALVLYNSILTLYSTGLLWCLLLLLRPLADMTDGFAFLACRLLFAMDLCVLA